MTRSTGSFALPLGHRLPGAHAGRGARARARGRAARAGGAARHGGALPAGLACALSIALLGLPPGAPRAWATPDGAWQQLPPPVTGGSPTFYDAPRQRMVIVGGALWALDLNPGGTWSRVAFAGNPPSTLLGGCWVLDPTRDRVVVWLGDASGAASSDRLWQLSLSDPPTWTKLAMSGTLPGDRNYAGAVYDPAGDRMVIFGGQSNDAIVGLYDRSDAWALAFAAGNAWTQLATSGPQPPAIHRPNVIYDSQRDRMVANTYPGGGGSTVWFLDLAGAGGWSSRALAVGPNMQTESACIYDAANDRMVLFGGCCNSEGGSSNETWFLPMDDAGQWSQLGGASPLGLQQAGAIYDSAHGRMVIDGGAHTDIQQAHLVASYVVNDTWLLDLGASPVWARLGAPAEGPVASATAEFPDDGGNRLLAFVGGASVPPDQRVWAQALDGTWGWTALSPGGDAPANNVVPFAIDPVGRRLFGFYDSWSTLYVYDMAHDRWSSLPTVGPPTQFTSNGATYDPVSRRLFVFGGQVSTLNGTTYPTTWILSLDPSTPHAWQEHAVTGPAPSLNGRVDLFYDPVADALTAVDDSRDLHYLALAGASTWVADTYYFPSLHSGAPVVHDARRDRILVFGGDDVGNPQKTVWVARHGTPVAALSPTGEVPGGRSGGKAVYEARHDRMIIEGGFAWKYAEGTDLYALTFSDPPQPVLQCGGDVVWTAGASVPVDYTVGNQSATGGPLSYLMTCDRDWPGFPLAGGFTLAGGTTTPLTIQVPVPDTAAVGAVVLTLWVGDEAVPYAGSTCSRHLHDASTPARLSLVDATPAADGRSVQLAWWTPSAGALAIERSSEGADWTRIATLAPGGAGEVFYTDGGVTPGAWYDYRAGLAQAGGGWDWSEIASVLVPGEHWTLSLAGGRAQVSSRGLPVTFDLPSAGRARLEAFDVVGRRVRDLDFDGLGAGRHTVRLDGPGELRPGMYFLRLTQNGRSVRGRALVLAGS